ncbi:MAG: carbohydrate-binding protein [Cytophagales bacterium]|nr:MAG: carbohydrate-binding protein [Cytophagales bacterium]
MKKAPYLLSISLQAFLLFLNFSPMPKKGGSNPDENRFSKIVLADSLSEPMELAVMKSGNVLFLERKGKIKLYNSQKDRLKTIAEFNVFSRFNDGMLGLTLDPLFEKNGWIYVYYSPNDSIPRNRLSRFLMIAQDSLVMSSEKVLLEVPVQRQSCCHSAGSLAFDKNGLLYLSIGDNINAYESDGFSPSDERPNRSMYDAQGSSANTNDLRGKILRIKPQADGTYSIPSGNLFPKDGSKGKPEIYAMGCRNPFRISIDNKKNLLYWGDIGPDSGKDSVQGVRGYDEINQTNKAGFFGWPYFIANNKAYNEYDFEKKVAGQSYSPLRPTNYSPNNTGDTLLPPAQPAFIWYPYGDSKDFPFVGKGGRNAMAGPVFYADEYANSSRKFPIYYDKKLFIYDWMRDWIFAVSLDEKNKFKSAERFLPNTKFDHIIDMEMGKDGAMYLLEYGQTWYSSNADARLVRVEYARGNRAPLAKIEIDKSVGKLPLTVKFSGENSVDYDKDESLTYQWFVGKEVKPFSTEKNAIYAFQKAGIYQVKLKVTDKGGKSGEQSVEIAAGNEPPQISVELKGNQTFYFDATEIPYQVKITDAEDKEIVPENIKVSFAYQATNAVQGHQQDALTLIEKNNCKACHSLDKKSVGPAYVEIAKKYADNEQNTAMLISKIRNGGNGNWGIYAMSAFPDVPENEIRAMVKYILGLNSGKNMPAQGNLLLDKHKPSENGKYTLLVSYKDKGTPETKMLTTQKNIIWRSPKLEAENYDLINGSGQKQNMHQPVSYQFVNNLKNGSWLMFKNIDLQGITKLKANVTSTGAGYVMEMRIGKADGALIGSVQIPDKQKFDWATLRSWEEVEIPINLPANLLIINDLYFIFSHQEKDIKYDCKVDWVQFVK